MAKRIEKVNELLKEEIGSIILKEFEFSREILVTITSVDCAPNLIQAKVWVSVLPENKSEDVLKVLRRRIFDVQQMINRRLNMRPIPKISFFEDRQPIEASRIEKLLSEVKKEEH